MNPKINLPLHPTAICQEELKTMLNEILGNVNYVYRFELYNRIVKQFDLYHKAERNEAATLYVYMNQFFELLYPGVEPPIDFTEVEMRDMIERKIKQLISNGETVS